MKTNFFITDNGIKLAYFKEQPKDSEIGVILVHGIVEHKGRYEDFIRDLHNAGISVFAVDLRGHGESEGTRGNIKKFDDYLEDLGSFVHFIKKENPKLKLALFGHSMGGLIAAAYTGTGDLVDYLILSSPSLKTPKAIKLFSWLPTKLLCRIYIKKRFSESKEMLKYSWSDPLAANYVSLGLLKAAFIGGVKLAHKNFKNIKIPVLMMGGKLDPTVNSGDFADMLELFGSKDKTLKIYDNAKHRLVQNAVKDEAIPDIINWLKSK
jgi:lysophospholipase